MSLFNETGPHFCPECPPTYRRPKDREQVREGARLQLSESNYSGCGVDMANCPECGRGYEIQYDHKVRRMLRAESWDVDLEAERRSAEEEKQVQEAQEREQLEKLKAKYEGGKR